MNWLLSHWWLEINHDGSIDTLESCQSVSSVDQSCLTLFDPMDYSTPGIPVHPHSWSLPKLMSIKSVLPSNHLILCCPLLLMPSIFPSIRVFSKESVLHHQVAVVLELQHWSFQ